MLQLKSFAKINIGLEVLHKRQDGYHEINTIFSKISFADDIVIEPDKELTVECIPEIGIHQEQNLAYKSGKLIQKYFACKSKGAKIKIFKNIPSGGGLGGGSSNAATVMKGLTEIWDLKASKQELSTIASELGADVPFFLGENFASGNGKGEKLEFFDFRLPYHILLVLPNIRIDTAWAYANLYRTDEVRKGSDLKNIFVKNINNPKKLRELIKNDFEEIVFQKYPQLAGFKEKLYSNGAVFALMSGSGSSIYGFFEDIEKLSKAEKELNKFTRTVKCEQITE